MVLAWPETQLDQSARIAHRLSLPAVVGLVAAHGFFTSLVPGAGSFPVQIVFANEGFLNGLGSFGVYFLLTANPRGFLPRAFTCRASLARTGRSGGRVVLRGRTFFRGCIGRRIGGRRQAGAHPSPRAHPHENCPPNFSPNAHY